MVPDRSPRRVGRVRALFAAAPVLPVRDWFNRWFRSVSDHVSEVGADTQQVVLRARDDVVHEVRSGRDDIAGRIQGRLDDLRADVRAEASGVTEVALATERRLARLEHAIAVLLEESDTRATAIVDSPWVHRALAASGPATIVLTGHGGRLAEELRACGHAVVTAAPDGTADLVILRDIAHDDLEGVLDAARRTLATGGRLVLVVAGRAPDKPLDGWVVLDERAVNLTGDRWTTVDTDDRVDRSLYVLG